MTPTPTVTVTESATSTVTATATTTEVPTLCGVTLDLPCYVEPTPTVYESWGLGLVLLVLFASALLVAQLRRGGGS